MKVKVKNMIRGGNMKTNELYECLANGDIYTKEEWINEIASKPSDQGKPIDLFNEYIRTGELIKVKNENTSSM